MNRRELEEQYALAANFMERRKTDGWWMFDPHSKQKPFIQEALRFPSENECWFLAGNRSGKSDAGAFVGAALARFGNQSARFVGAAHSDIAVKDTTTGGWVVSLDFPSSRDIIQPKYFDNGYVDRNAVNPPFIPDHEIEAWEPQDQILKLKNGSMIGFKSCESGRGKFQGTGRDWIHFDEEPPKEIYTECTIRVAAGRRTRLFGTCTLLPPAGSVGGVTWVYNEKVKAWQQGRPGIKVFTASIYDNPHLLPSEIERLEAIYPEGSLERRIRLNGELLPTTAGARVYGNFERRVHVVKQQPPQLRRPLCWLWDFNVEPMVTLIGQRDGRTFKIMDELWLEQGNLPAMCDMFKQRYPTHLAELRIYGDASGNQRSHQSNRSSYAIIRAEMMNYPVPLKILVPNENPSIVDRINAMNYAMHPEDGEVNFEVDPACSNLIDDLEQVVSDGKGGIRKTQNRKDVYYWRTHASDAAGYWVTYEAPVLSTAGRRRGESKSIPTPRYA